MSQCWKTCVGQGSNTYHYHQLSENSDSRVEEIATAAADGWCREMQDTSRECRDPADAEERSQWPLVEIGERSIYCVDSDPVVKVHVIRRGNLNIRSEVNFRTEDLSAEAGKLYKATKGRLIFEPGQISQVIQVEMLNDEFFNPTTEFKVILLADGIKGAQVSDYSESSVKRIETSAFPSDALNDTSLKDADPWLVLRELFKLLRSNKIIRKGTNWCIGVDFTHNLVFFLSLFMSVYLINNILTRKGDLWLIQIPQANLIAYTGINIITLALLHVLDYSKLDSKVEGTARLYLQSTVLTKYLNLTSVARQNVNDGDVIMAVQRDSLSVVKSGYVGAFSLIADVVKLLFMMAFKLVSPLVFGTRFDFSGIIPLFVFPVFLSLVLPLRRHAIKETTKKAFQKENEVTDHVDSITDNFDLILDYDKRSYARQAFVDASKEYATARKAAAQTLLNTDYMTKWITTLIVGAYVVVGGLAVLQGYVTVGVFITNIKIFDSCGDSFVCIFNKLIDFEKCLPAVMNLFDLMSRESDSWGRMQIAQETTKVAAKQMAELSKDNDPGEVLDLMTIDIDLRKSVSFLDPAGVPRTLNFSGNLTVSQGSMVAFLGDPGAGKTTFLNIIAGRMLPLGHKDHGSSGEPASPKGGPTLSRVRFFLPPHLRVINVSSTPVFYHGTLLQNLTFTNDQISRDHVQEVCRRLRVPEEVFDNFDKEGDWATIFSNSTCQLLNIARACIFNADITCFHKPLEKIDTDTQPIVMMMLREHIDNKGLAMPDDEDNLRRPNTIFLTSVNPISCLEADLIYNISLHNGLSEVTKEMAVNMLETHSSKRRMTVKHSQSQQRASGQILQSVGSAMSDDEK